MDSFFARYKSLITLFAVLLLQFIALATQMHRPDYGGRADGHHVRLARAWEAWTIVPVEKGFWRVGHTVREAWHGYVDLRHVRQHDRDLQYQIDQLRLQQAGMLEDARQGQRLQRLLGFKEQYVGKTVAAQVIGTGGSDRSRILILNKGSNDGLQPDMAVITPDGIVGKLRDVYPNSSQLLLINDVSSGTGVLLTNVRSRGVLRGSANGRVRITSLLPDDRIKPGEPVVTSGGDRVFPRGLNVGVVDSVQMDPDHQPYTTITLKTAANLDRLEEVLVITDVAQQLAASAASDGDDANRRASEIVAERLPGLKEADKKNAQDEKNAPPMTEAQAKAAGHVSAKPALHPDRYSPGSAPNAADLQPGGR
ncbi:rod shape-determining protein MreC [Terriglobus aquaticus]|uniref:Cell shape-determining protein MreC n=1 Tax=Terriglobus aquaticus TaxID=940139 RepID=A0ABW9KLC1_9BACT|nr:rod shape-determining protein MreC [Terriglobus aquaticus]